MAKINQLLFICDDCANTLTVTGKGGFPYHEGWIYVHKFNGQLFDSEEVVRFDLQDKHFCCQQCAHHFLSKTLEDA